MTQSVISHSAPTKHACHNGSVCLHGQFKPRCGFVLVFVFQEIAAQMACVSDAHCWLPVTVNQHLRGHVSKRHRPTELEYSVCLHAMCSIDCTGIAHPTGRCTDDDRAWQQLLPMLVQQPPDCPKLASIVGRRHEATLCHLNVSVNVNVRDVNDVIAHDHQHHHHWESVLSG